MPDSSLATLHHYDTTAEDDLKDELFNNNSPQPIPQNSPPNRN
jgi:hypothetical protein